MKTLINYFLGLFTVMSLSNCANGKKLQEEAPVALQEVYYVTHRAQDDSSDQRLYLYIPVEVSLRICSGLVGVRFFPKTTFRKAF